MDQWFLEDGSTIQKSAKGGDRYPMPYILITLSLMIKERFLNFDYNEFVQRIENLKTIIEFVILLIQLYNTLNGKEKKKS